jgi:hypothetical protein
MQSVPSPPLQPPILPGDAVPPGKTAVLSLGGAVTAPRCQNGKGHKQNHVLVKMTIQTWFTLARLAGNRTPTCA